MKSVVVIILAIFFCFLAYLEAVAQEISTNTVAMALTADSDEAIVAGSDISQTIDYGLQIICESEGEVYRIDFKGGFECGGLELGYN